MRCMTSFLVSLQSFMLFGLQVPFGGYALDGFEQLSNIELVTLRTCVLIIKCVLCDRRGRCVPMLFRVVCVWFLRYLVVFRFGLR